MFPEQNIDLKQSSKLISNAIVQNSKSNQMNSKSIIRSIDNPAEEWYETIPPIQKEMNETWGILLNKYREYRTDFKEADILPGHWKYNISIEFMKDCKVP